jgi:hypothetical protein
MSRFDSEPVDPYASFAEPNGMPPYLRYPDLERDRDWWRRSAIVGWMFCGLGWALFVGTIVALLSRPAKAMAQSPQTRAAANADRARFPASDWGSIFYLTTDALRDERQITAGRTTAFVVSSFSRAAVLEHHVPVEVARGLYRIDLRGLEWDWRDWHAVLKSYPYAPESRPLPLIVRADWLCVELADNFESDAGYRLLYGGRKIPKTRDEFLKLWSVGKGAADPLLLAHIEQESGVSLLKVRRIENRPTSNRGYAWGTEDNARRNFNGQTDPLETLLGGRRHDAEEWIVGFPKLSVSQGAGGMAQAYLLANGQGKRQDRAPVDIVEDHHRFRGVAEIRNSGSCIGCHAEGIRPLTRNDLRDVIAAGVELYADKRSQQLIEQTYLADLRLAVEALRNQEDYTAFVALVSGWGPQENARAFRQLVDEYDATLDLADCARELYVTPQELTHAFGYASQKQVKLGARLAGVVHGREVTREYWESSYATAFAAVQLWRQATP